MSPLSLEVFEQRVSDGIKVVGGGLWVECSLQTFLSFRFEILKHILS